MVSRVWCVEILRTEVAKESIPAAALWFLSKSVCRLITISSSMIISIFLIDLRLQRSLPLDEDH
jgi:hypothetical protein